MKTRPRPIGPRAESSDGALCGNRLRPRSFGASCARRLAIGTALLLGAAAAHAVTVFVAHGSTRVRDPALATYTDANHEALANIASGEFKAYTVVSAVNSVPRTFSGIENQLVITNLGGAFTIPAGALWDPILGPTAGLGVHIEGSYDIVPTTPGGSIGTSTAKLTVDVPGTTPQTRIAEYGHSVYINGVPGGTNTNAFVPSAENGASVVMTEASDTGLNVDLLMPDITLATGQSMRITFQLGVQAQQGATSVDFYNTARLFLVLPAGAVVAHDATVPLTWITTVPEPGTYAMLLAGLGLVGLAARRRSPRLS